jgi:hypothetical protein
MIMITMVQGSDSVTHKEFLIVRNTCYSIGFFMVRKSLRVTESLPQDPYFKDPQPYNNSMFAFAATKEGAEHVPFVKPLGNFRKCYIMIFSIMLMQSFFPSKCYWTNVTFKENGIF